MKRDRIKYRVAPLSNLGRFPFDMLRYDGAFPSTQTDSAAIESSTFPGSGELRPVELIATFNGSPNDARWRSFGWHVTHVWNGFDWEPYSAQSASHRLRR